MGPGAKTPSKLSSAAVDDNTTDLFWLTQAGRISGKDVGDSDLRGNTSGLWAEGTDALSASPTSSLTALASSSTSTRLWWITKEGSVQMAVRFEGIDAGPRKWNVSIDSGSCSASAGSEIAAVLLNEEDLRLWWIGGMGELKHARKTPTKDPSPSCPCQLLLPAGAITRKGRNDTAAAAMSGQEMRVWFINNHAKLFSMRWQQQTLEA